MEQEGAASSAPDERPSDDTAVASDVTSGIATVEAGVEQTIVETPENPVGDTVKEEEVDFNPEEENDIVGEFLGVEVETCDLLDIGESGQPSSSTLPAGQGAASGAPEIDLLGDVAPASAEPDTTTGEVAVGSSPSAPSRPPRTRGARGGKDKIYKDYRRVFYQGFEQLKAFLAEHLVSRPGRSNFVLQWVDFERAPQRLQELLINWQFFRNSATIQQILCEAEFLISQVAHHVSQHGYNGEGTQTRSTHPWQDSDNRVTVLGRSWGAEKLLAGVGLLARRSCSRTNQEACWGEVKGFRWFRCKGCCS